MLNSLPPKRQATDRHDDRDDDDDSTNNQATDCHYDVDGDDDGVDYGDDGDDSTKHKATYDDANDDNEMIADKLHQNIFKQRDSNAVYITQIFS